MAGAYELRFVYAHVRSNRSSCLSSIIMGVRLRHSCLLDTNDRRAGKQHLERLHDLRCLLEVSCSCE